MLTALFLTLIGAGLVLHFILVERPRMRARQVEPSLPEPLPLAEAVEGLPQGAFLQPTFTWIRLLPDGHLLLGLHPMVVSLVGSPYSLEVIPEGWMVRKGAPLLRIEQGRRHLELRSPVSGRIAEVNPHACMERGWTHPRNGRDCWVYRVEPENVVWDLPSWLQEEAATEWIQERYREIRSFLSQARTDAPREEEIPVGVLAQADLATWRGFEERFLTPEGAPKTAKTPWRRRMNPFRRAEDR